MFDRPVISTNPTSLDLDARLATLQAMLATIRAFAGAKLDDTAWQYEILAGDPRLRAARYAGANSITRRRFDAILREAETVGTAGLRLIDGRRARGDAATIAAARFLSNAVGTAIRRLENLLPARAI